MGLTTGPEREDEPKTAGTGETESALALARIRVALRGGAILVHDEGACPISETHLCLVVGASAVRRRTGSGDRRSNDRPLAGLRRPQWISPRRAVLPCSLAPPCLRLCG